MRQIVIVLCVWQIKPHNVIYIVNLVNNLKLGVEWAGELSLFMTRAVQSIRHSYRRIDQFIIQCEFIGVTSVGILFVAALFMGAVLGYQLFTSFALFGAEALVGGTVGVTIFREMGPVLGAVMVTGRAGAAIAAEMASMRVSEQIDALEVMGVDPYEYLVVPRIVAGSLMMPILAYAFGVVGTFAAYWVSCSVLGLSGATFWAEFKHWMDWTDLLHCLCKSISFGFALTMLGCFYGFRAEGGARAVGFATRSTVVASCLTILLLDYFWTMVLPLRANMLIVR